MDIKDLLGRYESRTINGMVAYVTFAEHGTGYLYEYGIKPFPPKEKIVIDEADLRERIGNAMEKGFRKVEGDEGMLSNPSKKFSLSDWCSNPD